MVRTTPTSSIEALGPKLWKGVGRMAWPLADIDPERLLDALPLAVVAVDGVGRVVYAAGPWKEWLGWPSSELVGRSLDETLKPRRSQAPRRLPRQKRRLHARDYLKRRDGGYLEFEMEVIHAPAGMEPIATLQVFRPIRRVELSQQHEDRTGDPRLDLLEGLDEPVLVSDEDHRGLWLNPAARRLFGVDRAWITHEDFAHAVSLRPLDASSTKLDLRGLLEQGEPARLEAHLAARPGQESIIELSITPSAGRQPAMILVRDVSEQHRVESDLSGHVSQLFFLLDHLPVGVLFFDAAQQCRLANGRSRALFRLSKRQVVGRGAGELLSGSARLMHALLRSAQQRSAHVLTTVAWQDGEAIRFLDWRFEPIGVAAAGQNSPVLVLIVDVTQRALAEQSLQQVARAAEQASRRKTQFMSGLSHDLRSPVNALSLQSELLSGLLKAKQVSDPEIDELLVDMRHVLANLNELLGHMLDLTRFEAGHVEDRPTQFALDDWMETTMAPFDATASAKGIDFTWRVDQPGRQVVGDRVKLGRVLGNLVGNAVKFTRGGSVDVRVEAGGDGGLVFTVCDTGPGIPADQLERVFDEFAQLGNPDRDPSKGSGLGLAICRRLVEGVGGQITVESTLGQGTTFTARYPASAAKVVDAEAATSLGFL